MILCDNCGKLPPEDRVFPDDVATWVCSTCAMFGVAKKEQQEKEYLTSITGEELKTLLKEKGMNIKELALTLKIHPQQIYQATSTDKPFPKSVVDWFNENK